MSCKVKIKSLDYLKEKGALDKGRIVKDLTLFNELNDSLTLLAETRYNIKSPNGEKLFKSYSKYIKTLDGGTNYIIRVEPNEELFNILQLAIDDYNETEITYIKKLDSLITGEKEYLSVKELNEKEPFSNENERGTISEFILFGNQDGNKLFKATEVLDNIISNYKGYNKSAEDIINKIKQIAEYTNAYVDIVNKENLDREEVYMQYNPNRNVISVSLDNIRQYSTDFAIRSFLHEVVHSVTVNAFRNPINTQQRIFNNYIKDAFSYYTDINNNELIPKKYYGFTNEVEFIAEIFSNEKFSNYIKRLDEKSNKPSIWNRIVDAIRSLLGLPLKSKYNPIINHNNVIKSILEISKTEQVDSNGDPLFMIKNPINKEEEKYTNLKTIEDKLDYTIDKVEESLVQNIKSLEFSAKITKDDTKVENIEKYIEDFRNILSDVNEFRITNQIAAVATFIGKMTGNLNYIKSRIDSIDYSNREQISSALNIYKNYLSTFSVINQINELISDIRTNIEDQDSITEEDLDKLETSLQSVTGQYSYLESRMYSTVKKGMRSVLNDIKYFKEVEVKHRNRLSNEYKQSGAVGERESWIIDKMLNRDKDLIQQDLDEAILELIENPSYDIMGADVIFSSAVNVSSPFVQILNQIISDIKNEKNSIIKERQNELSTLFDKLVEEKGTSDIKTLYKNILVYDKSGKAYLKGDYKIEFYDEVHRKINNIRKEIRTIREEASESLTKIKIKYGLDSKQYLKEKQSIDSKIKNKESQIEKLQEDNVNFDENDNVTSIKDKWKTNLDELSSTEKEVLQLFKDRIEESHKNTFGQMSLINYSYKSKFYELPKVTKTDLERILTDRGKGIIKDKFKDLTEIRADDVGFSTIKTDLENNRVFNLKVHYRDRYNNFSNKDQSLDLFNLIRLETENGIMFKTRKEYEPIIHSLLEIAKNKKYYQKEGTNKLVNFFSKKLNTVKGNETNTYKMMQNIVEQKFYDIFNKNNVKLGKADLNKTVKFINSASAFLTLSLNIASGTANVLNANSQLFLESFIKGKFIDSKGLAKANSIYGLNMVDTIKDLTNPINKSFVNQVNELFDIKDSLNLTDSGFLRTNMIKAGMDSNALQVFHTSGEHWVQSVTTMAVLDKIKVFNEEGKPINKQGKVVSEKSSASLLDMLEVDKVTGEVKVSDKVVYTSHSRLTKWNEGGKTNVDLLIRKKLYDTVGNYTQLDQPEIMRHWGGKLMMLYRKYLIPMGQARLRGWETSFKSREKLSKDDKRFSYALQEYEEGTYVSLIRYMNNAILNKKAFILAKPEWNKLSDYEKHNIKRAVTEIVMVYAMLPLALAFVKAAAEDDPDKEYLFFLAYQLRRLDTELSQYQSMKEMFKIMRSPIPSARLLETASYTMFTVINPVSYFDGTFTEKYKAGNNKGKNKFSTKLKKQLPVVKEFQRTYQDLLKYQESNFGTGL